MATATSITIPVDVYLITILLESYAITTQNVRSGKTVQKRRTRVKKTQRIPPEVSNEHFLKGIKRANEIFQPASISFEVGQDACHTRETVFPGNADTVTKTGFGFLYKTYGGTRGIRVFVVRRFASKDLGGASVESWEAAIMPRLSQPLFGNVLAHEFGHLLGLEHVLSKDPNDVSDNSNLMYPGLSAAHNLTPGQIKDARKSKLVKKLNRTKSK